MCSHSGSSNAIFARLFLRKPLIAFLDEATSALDEPNERVLYEHLRNLDMAYVSIGHRSTLREFHDLLLTLYADGRVELSQLRTDHHESLIVPALMSAWRKHVRLDGAI